ncbi:hypothetical protein IWX91DRAFT_177218 [Phyllosticta citricarpa]
MIFVLAPDETLFSLLSQRHIRSSNSTDVPRDEISCHGLDRVACANRGYPSPRLSVDSGPCATDYKTQQEHRQQLRRREEGEKEKTKEIQSVVQPSTTNFPQLDSFQHPQQLQVVLYHARRHLFAQVVFTRPRLQVGHDGPAAVQLDSLLAQVARHFAQHVGVRGQRPHRVAELLDGRLELRAQLAHARHLLARLLQVPDHAAEPVGHPDYLGELADKALVGGGDVGFEVLAAFGENVGEDLEVYALPLEHGCMMMGTIKSAPATTASSLTRILPTVWFKCITALAASCGTTSASALTVPKISWSCASMLLAASQTTLVLRFAVLTISDVSMSPSSPMGGMSVKASAPARANDTTWSARLTRSSTCRGVMVLLRSLR